MTTVVNPGLGQAEQIFKDLAWDNFVTAVLVYFHIDFWPVNSIVRLFTDKLYEALRLTVDLGVITFLNEEHKKAFEESSLELKIIAHDKGIDSPEFKKAREDAKQDLARFVAYPGA